MSYPPLRLQLLGRARMWMGYLRPLLFAFVAYLGACAQPEAPERFDVLLLGGTVYSGNNAEPVIADVGINGDRIAAVGELGEREAALIRDVRGLAIAPGFIDIHSHAVRSDRTTAYSAGRMPRTSSARASRR